MTARRAETAVQDKRTGGCACGAVRFSAEAPFRPVIACHCETCRRQSGHFVAATAVAKSGFTLISGSEDVQWWQSTPQAKRGFCSICGSLLFWKAENGDAVSIMAGSMDLPTGLSMLEHIHVAEKSDYYDLNDDLPKRKHADYNISPIFHQICFGA